MKCNFDKLEKKIFTITNEEYEYFFSKPHVVGIGMGYKIVRGICTNERCIAVFVNKKILKGKLNSNDIIPKEYKEIKTNVIETGNFKPAALTGRIRPTIGGYSIGPVMPPKILTGSIGGLVTDDVNYYILGNNHVLAGENTVPIGTPVVQPSILDGGKVSKDTIGNLYKYIPINFVKSTQNYVDCAIVKLLAQYLASPEIAFLGIPKGIDQASLGQIVKKVGRTTELTYGSVTEIGATVLIEYSRGDVLMKNQVVTTVMGKEGDSGTLCLNNNGKVVGLLAGIAETRTLYNPIYLVLNNLKVKLVTG